jgi:glycosyltransferase involved in cell wall biosynthesis
MKIAILGTKGIPNNYGGYEQFAEFISTRLIQRGHSVTVYNPHFHKFKGDHFNGVTIIRKFSPEAMLGGAANIIYDHLCLKDALQRDFDIIYEAGYHSVALSYKYLKVDQLKKPIVITNMDGLEWRRSKWNKTVQNIIKGLERIAVAKSPYLISDNEGIQEYLMTKYKAESFYIPYGADPVKEFDESLLQTYDVKAEGYLMLVARLEPENNVETILDGYCKLSMNDPLLVVGNHATSFGNHLKNKFKSTNVKFVGGIYNKAQLDSLRHFSLAYFHGHSVGGTNPSLLEAMASESFIIAHENPFNASILNDAALYFKTADNVCDLLKNIRSLRTNHLHEFVRENNRKISTTYKWEKIVDQHEELFKDLLEKNV